jgi:hypothetical protein
MKLRTGLLPSESSAAGGRAGGPLPPLAQAAVNAAQVYQALLGGVRHDGCSTTL